MAVTFPPEVTDVPARLVIAFVVTTGRLKVTVEKVTSLPYEVPATFVAYARM